MKYAILESGGKQYVAREGEAIEIDRLPLEIGKSVEFKEILLTADNGTIIVGTPTVKGASVKGRVLDQIKAAKVIVFKYVPKQRYRRKQGHRQQYTRVEIEKINLAAPADKKAEVKVAEEKAAATKEKPKAEAKPAAKKSTARKPSTSKPTAKKTEKSTTKPTAAKSSTPKKDSTKSAKPAAKKSESTTTKGKASSTRSKTKK